MAKKKEVLTIEEKLEKAIVPDWEQPYKVPSNWVWTRLGEVCNFENGYAFKSVDYKDSGVPLIRISNIKNNSIDFSDCMYIQNDVDEKFYVEQGDLLIALSGATTGKNGVYPFEEKAYLNQRVGNIKVANEQVLMKKFRDYYIEEKTDDILKKAYGGAQPNISPKDINAFMISLPPLAEQKRIVDRIESLFSKLDEAKELAQSALDSFENRKSAILHTAFTGELTKKWREKNGVGFESWDCLKLGDIVKIVKDKYDPTTESTNLRYIGLENIEKSNGIISYGNSEVVKSLKTRFLKGDILYGKLRPYLNKHDITTFNGICSTDILVFRVDNIETASYVNYFMNSSLFIDYAVSNSKGINLPRVAEKDLKIFMMNLPTLPEQAEIVRILDSIFEKETKAKECANVIEQIDLMKKAILARAFRGELGTNDMGEESAVGLLKEIISQQENEPTKHKKRNEKKVLVDGNVIAQLATDFEEILYKYIAENQPISMSSILDSISSSKQLDALDTVSTLCKKGFVINKDETYSIK